MKKYEFFEFCRLGNINAVERMLGSDPALVAAKDIESNSTALHYAVANSNVGLVLLLIKKGAEIDAQDEFGFTALHYAAFVESPEIAKALISNGASVNAVNEDNETPLHETARNECTNLAELLIASGANLEAKDIHNMTPLAHASYRSNPAMIHYLSCTAKLPSKKTETNNVNAQRFQLCKNHEEKLTH